MAAPTGTFQTYQAIGDREDLHDDIYDITPMDVPFMSNIPQTSASNSFHEWQTDVLSAASADNATVEGDDATTDTATPTVRLGNYTQILDKVVRVTSTLRATDTAGRRDEFSYQQMKRGRELKRDIESSFLSANAATAGSSTAARKLAGAGAWLWENQVQQGASATTPTVTSQAPTTAPTAGTTATFTEANLTTLLADIWDSGGDPTVIMVGSHNKGLASNFSGIASLYKGVGQNPATIIGSADAYIGEFGELQIVANRFSPAGTVYAFDMDFWEAAYLETMHSEPLAKTGHSDRSMITCEVTLCAKNPDSSGKIYTTTTS